MSIDPKSLDLYIYTSMSDGLVAWDMEFRYTRWNRFMEKLTGVLAPEVLGKVVYDVFPFLREIGEDRFLEMALRGETVISSRRKFTISSSGKTGFFEGHY